MKIKYFLAIMFSSSILLNGCSIIHKIAGADIDPEEFDAHRKAKMYEIRHNSMMSLSQRLLDGKPVNNADIVFYLDEDFLTKILSQFIGARGMLDESTSYLIKDVILKLDYGSALAHFEIQAYNDSYDIDVDLALDCIISIKIDKSELVLLLEPFNISPDVKAGGLLSYSEDLIRDLIKINLADIGRNLGQTKLPIDLKNSLRIEANKAEVRSKVNLDITIPEWKLDYSFKLKEVLIFMDAMILALDLNKSEVR